MKSTAAPIVIQSQQWPELNRRAHSRVQDVVPEQRLETGAARDHVPGQREVEPEDLGEPEDPVVVEIR